MFYALRFTPYASDATLQASDSILPTPKDDP
jgi:hypothetical protein